MQKQVTVRMPEDLLERLDRRAERQRRKRSDVIRLAVERWLDEGDGESGDRPIDKVRDLIGAVETGISDLGQNHREHLIRRLRRAR